MADTTKEVYQILSEYLKQTGYVFVCPSPETQGRVVAKRCANATFRDANNATDFFGWNLSCTRDVLESIIPPGIFEDLLRAGLLATSEKDRYSSTIRVSNLYLPKQSNSQKKSTDTSIYYIHSSFPARSNSVFFGPDTYLFIALLQESAVHISEQPRYIIDVCCGSGAGAIHLARTYPAAKVLGLDLNPHALRLGDVNAQLANCNVKYNESDLYSAVADEVKEAGVDLIVSNPPYIASTTGDKDLPIYADGGANFGLDISIRIVEEGIQILSSGGLIIIYTGVAIPAINPRHDPFFDRLNKLGGAQIVEYTVLHPDMWPEEIGQGAYADVGRIQVVGAVIKKNDIELN